MKAEEALSVAKTYVNETVIGMGALKGAPCTIKSQTKSGRLTTTVFEWTDKDGNKHENTMLVYDGENGANGADGADGKSAYQLAVDQGYVGTLDEWLASLHGADGTDGTDGTDGESAYELAVDHGYVGTEVEWLASLHGADGTDGTDGTDGESAYQLAVDQGYVGTLDQWLASLHGADGNDGTDGYSPTIVVKSSTSTEYILTITDKNGSYDTPNLKGSSGGGGGGATVLSDLTDVQLTSLASGDALIWNGSKWVNLALAAVATSGSYSDLSNKPTLGTAAAKDVPASGDASTTEVVMGDDSRLTDARTPVAHTHTVSQITDFPALGTAAAKDSTNAVTQNSTDLVESGAVYTALGDKADKVSGATNGNFAGLDSNGNLTDSGSKASDFLTSHQDISGKADKVQSATNGDFAGLDANGNLTDSGSKAADFAAASHTHTVSQITDFPTLGTAAAKDSTNAVTQSSTDLVESGAVYSEVSSLNSAKENKPTVITQTLSASATSLTFTDASIGNNSRIRAYSDPFVLGLITDMTQSGTSVTLTCNAQESAVSVSLEVRN